MASKKSARKKSAAKKSAARKTETPKIPAANLAQRRRAAVERARDLYKWEANATPDIESASVLANLAALGIYIHPPCTPAELCTYLTSLGNWFVWFQQDYMKLRQAVCNVERRAWGGPGDTNLRFCKSGSGSDPADPTPPPVWT